MLASWRKVSKVLERNKGGGVGEGLVVFGKGKLFGRTSLLSARA